MREENHEVHDAPSLAAAMRDGRTDAFLQAARRGLDDEGWSGFASTLIIAHRRGGELDLAGILKGEPGTRVAFATQQLVERVVPAIGLDLDEMLAMTRDAVARGGDGATPYWMSAAWARWCEADPGNPTAALAALRSGRAPGDLAHVVVAAGMKVDRARFLPVVLAMVGGEDVGERDAAANVLGRIEDLAAADLARVVSALRSALASASGGRVVAPLRALLAIAVRDAGATDVGQTALDEVRPRADRHVREAIAMEMMFGVAKAPSALAREALALLHDTTADEIPSLEGIDHILSQNLTGPLAADIASLADALLTSGAASMKRLDSYEHHLLADAAGALPATVRRWLLADVLELHRAVRDVCQAVHGEPLTFDLDFSDAGIAPERAVSIARRACAVLLLSPEAAASIIVSLMRTGPVQAMPALAATLWDPLLMSYWTGPRAFLETVLPTFAGEARDAVTGVIAKLDRYTAAVAKARDLPELRPSQHHRHLAAMKRHKEHLAIEKAAREGSVLASLFPMSVMLFGDSAVHDVVSGPGDSVRQETPLGVHEYSHELPRLDVIDPFGTWYQRAHMIRDGEDR